MKHYQHRDDCRLCGATTLELVLPILPSAIGDAFVSKEDLDEPQELFPLDTYLCLACGHLQNLDVVDPEILFRNYTYRTSASMGLVAHFREYAQSVVDGLRVPVRSLVVEIGSNDGSLLKAFKALGMRVAGVDPAKSIAAAATAEGINTVPEFFTSQIAQDVLARDGPASLVCANNVFAHADNISDIVKGIRLLLGPDGVFVFEVSYVPDIVDHFVFDTIYHEHVSHHALIPLERFFNRLDMSIFDVQRVSTKGGSIRGFAQPLSCGKRPRSGRCVEMFEQEPRRGFERPEIYRRFYLDIEERKQALLAYLDRAIAEGRTIAGYGASTTTTTLLYHFELQTRLKFILDDNPLKAGMYSPGAHIPVYASSALYTARPDIVVILAWQYAAVIMKKHGEFMAQGGRFVVPLADMQVFP